MNNPIFKKKQFIQVLFCILFFNLSFGNLTSFALQLNVTPTNETCPGNGRLDFLVTDTTPGSTIIYTVYKLPNIVTPIVTTQANTFTGLVAANYRVIATESLPNGNINTQQIDTVILNHIVPLQLNFLVTDETCQQLGSVTITTLRGQPVLYEIISGPISPISQSSSIFTGLTSGSYQIKITDNCGAFITQNIIVDYLNPNLIFSSNLISIHDCSVLNVKNNITTNAGQLMYPITALYTIHDPSGNVTTASSVIPSGNSNSLLLSQFIPFYYGQTYYYSITLTDGCGNVFTSEDFLLHPIMEVASDVGVANCNGNTVKISVNEFGFPPFTASFLNAPPGFVPSVFNNLHPNFSVSPFVYYNASIPMPIGNYEMQITDACGRVKTTTFIIQNNQPQLPSIVVSQLKGCAVGYSSLNIAINDLSFQIVTAELEIAPSTYTTNLPLNLNPFIYNGKIYLSNLSSGDYKFKITDNCGNSRDVYVTVVGYQVTSNNFSVIEGCSSFGLNLQNVSNIPSSVVAFWLQKFNPSTNEWIHPLTGVSFSNGINNNNALQLLNNLLNTVNNSVGRFRIVKSYYNYKLPTPSDLSSLNICLEQLGEFEFYFEPRIKDIYSFSCGNSFYQVVVEAIGVASIRYEIIEKDSMPFYIDNANSSVFNGMAPGVYTFRVTDFCGNQSLRLFEVSGNVTLPITATVFCDGSVGSLSVPYFSYLQYEWWKDNNTSTILSTSNSLHFTPFNLATDFGTYHVKITNPGNPNTCINFTVDYTIQGSITSPNAGGDTTISYCGNQGTVNLFSLLSGTYDSNGNWQELTNSGTLIGNSWNSTNVPPGIYNFKYAVNGLCGLQDEALVTITIKDIPQTPIASFDSIVCDTGTLQLHATPVAGATYLWNGPNGFTSTLQNPVIANISASNNGVYTIIAVKEGCPSESNSIVVDVKNVPNFSISETCFNGIKQLRITSTGDSITQDFSNYVWTFPDGTSHTGNPITIANGNTGVYSVEVQNQDNCITSKQIMVKCTSCGYIPKGVSANEDNLNDSFDLQCLEDVKNVKIFNRYGILLFNKDNYLNEWKGYDKNGTLLPTATYYYLITFGSGETKTGWVYLNY